MRILVINSGSSSIKFQLLQMEDESLLLSGLLERIGEAGPRLALRRADGTETRRDCAAADHRQGMSLILDALQEAAVLGPDRPLAAIGHRVVHGGERFRSPTRLDAAAIDGIRACIPLAPLHNPANLAGIAACRELFPQLPQVAVFDTAFHQSMPETAWRYAVPDAWYREFGVRRYGFHGTSHAYVARRAAAWLGRPAEACNLVTLHLGNGASMAAIQAGRCIDTSMGMTPLEGLVMGTRSGDIDPAIPAYLGRVAGLGPDAIDASLNQHAGLKALCGDNDMRRVLERAGAGDVQAEQALAIYCYRLRKYLGGYLAVLGRVDAIVFTGGIGENAAPIRARTCAGLEHLGIRLDPQRNDAVSDAVAPIHRQTAEENAPALLVIRTNEELEIARQARDLCRSSPC